MGQKSGEEYINELIIFIHDKNKICILFVKRDFGKLELGEHLTFPHISDTISMQKSSRI